MNDLSKFQAVEREIWEQDQKTIAWWKQHSICQAQIRKRGYRSTFFLILLTWKYFWCRVRSDLTYWTCQVRSQFLQFICPDFAYELFIQKTSFFYINNLFCPPSTVSKMCSKSAGGIIDREMAPFNPWVPYFIPRLATSWWQLGFDQYFSIDIK